MVMVYSQDGNYRRSYTITVNVHKQRGNEFTWKAFDNNANFAMFENAKMINYNGKIYVFGKKGTQPLVTLRLKTMETLGHSFLPPLLQKLIRVLS